MVSGNEIYLPLAELIDLEVERDRLGKERQRLQGLLKGVTTKLANEQFLARAPEDVVLREKLKSEELQIELEKVNRLLQDLK